MRERTPAESRCSHPQFGPHGSGRARLHIATPLRCLSCSKSLRRGKTCSASDKEGAPIDQTAHRAPRLFRATGPRLARAVAGSLARHVDAAEIGESPRKTQTGAHFGISVHKSSHHPGGVSAGSSRVLPKILPTLVSYRRACGNPATFSPSPGVGDVALDAVTKTLRPGDLILISPNSPRHLNPQCEA